jgi:cell fate regulator YaaT (PSP1 superfamily)
MPVAVGVAFRPVGKITQYDPGALTLQVHDAVIVETASGVEFGFIRTPARAIPDAETPDPFFAVVRHATEDDFARRERNEQRQAEAALLCRQKIVECDVPMKLIETEWAFDGSQVTFHFVAEARVDFRELVREIAAVLHTRVQMHQIGPRDHAKVFPGIGPCGRPTCCSTFLREFKPVSMKMARGQHLTLNPSKFSGLCGKLMCCLRYEQVDDEDEGRRNLPNEGMVVMTPMGRAKVMEVNAVQQRLTVQLETQAFVEVLLKDVSEVPGCVDHTEGGCTDCSTSGVLTDCTVPTRDKPTTGPSLPVIPGG